jgi:Icc-related predicted phosphoesterase
VVSCGDLPFDYLEFIVSRLDVPLLYVPGNHDPELRSSDPTWSPLRTMTPAVGPQGCDSVDGRVVTAAGLRVAGLGGSMRYKRGPNQYTDAEMRWRALSLEVRIRLNPARAARRIDVLLTHAPPLGLGAADDRAHRGFAAFPSLIKDLSPKLLVHGHIHPYGRNMPERLVGSTRIVNAVPSRMIEL